MRKYLASLLLVSQVASAQTWAPVTNAMQGANHYTVYIDTASKKVQGPWIKAWFRFAYKEPVDDSFSGRRFTSTTQLYFADCAKGSMAAKQAVWYADESGTVLRSYSEQESKLEFEDPIPGTVGVQMIQALCARR